jgi:hypothetical protein
MESFKPQATSIKAQAASSKPQANPVRVPKESLTFKEHTIYMGDY